MSNVELLYPEVTVTLPGVTDELRPSDGDMQLDSTVAPYAQSVVRLPFESGSPLESLDPRADTRVVVHATNQGHWEPTPPTYSTWVLTRRNLATAGTQFPLGNADLVVGPTWDGVDWDWQITAHDPYHGTRLDLNNLATEIPIGDTLHATWEFGNPGAVPLVVGIDVGDSPVVWRTIAAGGRLRASDHAVIEGAGYRFVDASVQEDEATFLIRQLVADTAPVDEYFDGDTPDSDLIRYSWLDTPGGSVSIEETRTRTDHPPHWVPAARRDFNLGLRQRDIDHREKTLTLTLASDEALLTDYAALVEDKGARAFQTSARAVCNYVLGKIGAALASGGADANVSAYWQITNMLPNPRASGAPGTYYAAGANATGVVFDNITAQPYGANAVFWNSVAAGWAQLTARQYTASEGRQYTMSAYVRQTQGNGMRARMNFRDSENVVIKSVGGATVTAAAAWGTARATLTATAPKGTARVGIIWEHNATAGGQGARINGPMVYEDGEVVPYFDPNTVPAGYAVVWEDVPNDSQSTRIPLLERDPEVFTWRPGVTAWDFLAAILTSANLRLFCDELRAWRLVTAEYLVPGYVPISPLNASRGVDTITRDDARVFATGVVARYTYVDSKGETRTKTSVAGIPQKVYTVDYAKAFPGAGAAAAILARRNGTGRIQDVDGIANWAATPGMSASINLPSALDQLGRITGVRWNLGDESTMSLATTGLMDVVPGSWLDTPMDEQWIDPPDLTWEEWT